MNNHFNLKSLAFYGCAISFVVILFSVVTSYGEAHVKAPRDIDGTYPIADADLPGCLQAKRFMLDIKQSGVYVTGALLAADADEKITKAVEQRPPLTGHWNNQQFSLEGELSHLQGCEGRVTINGTINSANKLDGTLRLNATEPKAVSAQRREAPKTVEGH